MSALNSVKFSCTALNNVNKAGELKKDADGYYEVVLGGLNVFNSSGEYYSAEGVRELFNESSLLMKRIQKGRLRGEYGHPKPQPGQSDQAFINRLFMIDEDRVCCHYKEVYLDDKRVKMDSGGNVIAIIGKICPSGPHGEALRKSLENKNENVSFSIRAFTDDQRMRGINNRYLKTIITWDYVNCPGIPIAEKWKSPSLESLDDRLFLKSEIERSIKQPHLVGVAQESVMLSAQELFTSMGWDLNQTSKPAFTKW